MSTLAEQITELEKSRCDAAALAEKMTERCNDLEKANSVLRAEVGQQRELSESSLRRDDWTKAYHLEALNASRAQYTELINNLKTLESDNAKLELERDKWKACVDRDDEGKSLLVKELEGWIKNHKELAWESRQLKAERDTARTQIADQQVSALGYERQIAELKGALNTHHWASIAAERDDLKARLLRVLGPVDKYCGILADDKSGWIPISTPPQDTSGDFFLRDKDGEKFAKSRWENRNTTFIPSWYMRIPALPVPKVDVDEFEELFTSICANGIPPYITAGALEWIRNAVKTAWEAARK